MTHTAPQEERRRPIRVLTAGASEPTILALDRELRSSGFDPVFSNTTDPGQFRGALQTMSWEVAIWEHPSFDGLGVHRDSGSSIPLLVIGESVADDEVSRFRSSGAHAYFDKSDISRLSAIVAFELREADVRTLRRWSDERMAESEARFQVLADTAPVILWATDAHGIRNYVNQRWIEYTALPLDPRSPEKWMESVHPEDIPNLQHRWQESFSDRRAYQAEFRLRRHDGTYRWFISRGVPRYSSDGLFVGYVGTSTDFSAVKEAESALRKHNERLQRLAFIASHDMREPLRTVSIYTQLLERRYANQLDDPAREFMSYVKAGVERIGKLMDDLLLYGEANLGNDVRERVDLNVARDTALTVLSDSLRRAEAEVHCDTLPTVYADPRHMVMVFQNLIANALKFRAERPLVISIRSDRSDDFATISVADNGIGIAEEYRTLVFELFKRLHGPQYPGTGVGLSLCQTIVENHGGHIWVTSNETGGSTFRFTLPTA